MILKPFSYSAPETLQEAISLLHEQESEVFTGDQAYVGSSKAGISKPLSVVSLRNVPGLNSVIHYGNQLVIGSSVTFAAMQADSAICSVPVLADALSAVKDPHLKNHSNVGGALCYRSLLHGPVLAAFLVLDGKVNVTGSLGDSQVTLEDYLTDGLTQGEIIRSISLTVSQDRAGSFHFIDYMKAGKIVCGVAVTVSKSDNMISKISLAACGCVPVPERLQDIESSLAGTDGSPESITAALNEMTYDRLVMSNLYISNPSYLLHLLKVLIKRAVLKS